MLPSHGSRNASAGAGSRYDTAGAAAAALQTIHARTAAEYAVRHVDGLPPLWDEQRTPSPPHMVEVRTLCCDAPRSAAMDWTRSSVGEAPRAAVNQDGASWVASRPTHHTRTRRERVDTWQRRSLPLVKADAPGRDVVPTYVQRDALQPSPLHRSRRARSLHPMSAGIR